VSNRREERREVGRGTRSVRSVRHSFHSSLTVRTSRVPILRLRLRNVVEGDVRRMERTRVNIPFSFRLITHYALFRHQKIECLLVSFPGSVPFIFSRLTLGSFPVFHPLHLASRHSTPLVPRSVPCRRRMEW